MKRIGWSSFRGILFCILCVLCMQVTCNAKENQELQEGKEIRVGYFNLSDYYQLDEDGEVGGMDAAYLSKISQYSNLSFTYVDCGTWANELKVLENHEIDLLGTMQWSKERENEYAMCSQSYGMSVAELVGLPECDVIYEDYEKISSLTIGVVEGYVRLPDFNQLCEEHNMHPNMIYYKTQEELLDALEKGEVDLIAANAHTVKSDYKVVEKFAYTAMYFASWSGNEELINQIDEALVKINLYESDFDDQTLEKYFPIVVNSPFSKEEIDCIQEERTYTVYLDDDTAPLTSQNEQSGEMNGLVEDICGKISGATGLKFEFKPSREAPKNPGKYDITYHTIDYSIENDNAAEKGITNSILDEEFSLYHLNGEVFHSDDTVPYKVAVVANRDGIYSYFEENYPYYEIVVCESPVECMKMLLSKDVDCAFLNDYVANAIIVSKNYNMISAVPTRTSIFGISLQFYGEDKQVLASIINKGMNLLDEDEIKNITLDYAMNVTPEITLNYLVQNNVRVVVLIIAVVVTLVIGCIFILIYAKVMRQQKKKIEQANHAKTEFFSRMSHDMRTPMNGILGIAALSEDETEVAELKANIDKIKDSGEYLLGLINDTLDFQRIESGKLVLEPQTVYLDEILHNLNDMILPTAKKKNVDYQIITENVNLDSYLKMDPLRTMQIFINLLSNAIKFTPENGKVLFKIEKAGEDERIVHARMSVSDTGVGMSHKFLLEQLYHPFAQEKNEMSLKYAGSGLGLSIVKSLVELMGGQIEVQSELGEGTTFFIQLDFERVDAKEATRSTNLKEQRENTVRTGLNGKRILLCEDHPLNAEIAKKLLLKVGCEVTWAQNGRMGLTMFEASESGHFDLILMDIRMPELDGIEATKQIRKMNRSDAKSIPIVAMTANAYDGDVKNSIQAGMNAHLSKPVDPNKMYQTIYECICNEEGI